MSLLPQISVRIEKLLNNLTSDFGLSKLSKSPARFNLSKLDWFNKEYLKMLSLEEFAFRTSNLKLKNSVNLEAKIDLETKEKKPFRIGDYVFLVDLEQNKIFGEISKKKWLADSNFYPVGSGREEDLSSIENLKKEVAEELNGQLKIDEQKLLKIASFRTLSETMTAHSGIEFNLYFYPVKMQNLQNCEEKFSDGVAIQYQWFDLKPIITNGKFINYPIWKNFCVENNLPCFEPGLEILTQYLALNLDKNRVIKLSEVG